jgi:methylglutaconyl-CoA hydratase
MSDQYVVQEAHGPVAVLVLNRPAQRNALNRAMVSRLGDALTHLSVDTSTRAVVLTGTGSVFCAGMDLKEAEEAGRGTQAEHLAVSDLQALADILHQLHVLNKPTVAALNGDAYAAGAGLITACDFIVASPGARIGYPEVKRGLVAAIVLHDLVRQVGDRRARALLLSGEPIAAAEAERWGLVNRVVPADACRAEAIALAESLTSGGPRALATIKRQIDEATFRSANLRGAAAVSAAVRVSEEALEGMRAFLEKRPPAWTSDRSSGEG